MGTTEQPYHIVLAGGGTAGHVNPLLSIATALKDLDPQVRLSVIGTPIGLEARLVPAAGLEIDYIDKVPFPRRPNKAALAFPRRWVQERAKVRKIMEERRPDLVVGVGGYAAAPAYSVAHSLKIPLVIHEQNARAGMANRLGVRWADFVGTVYDDTGIRPGKKTRVQKVGLPLRAVISDMASRLESDPEGTRSQARRELGLREDEPLILVTGGSLGALSINEAVSGAAADLVACAQVLHLTGRGKLDQVEKTVASLVGGDGSSAKDYRAIDYWERMDLAFAAADLIICRSGAGTVAEVSALGRPAIYVPLPIGNGEQRLNAEPLVRSGGGIMVADAAFTSDWVRSHVPALVSDKDRLGAMARAAWNYGVRDAATVMARRILDLAASHAASDRLQ